MELLANAESRLDPSFVVFTATFQLLFMFRMAYCGFRHREYLRNVVHRTIAALGISLRPSTKDERLFLEQVGLLRLQIARIYFRYVWVMLLLPLLVVELRVLQDSPRYLSAGVSWSMSVTFVVGGLVDMFPSVLSVRNLNAAYFALALGWATYLSPWHSTPNRSAEISLFLLCVGRVPAVGIASSPVVVASGNLLPLLVVLLRATAEPMPPSSMFAEISALVANVCVSVSVQFLLNYRIEHSMQYKKMASDFNAASSLLHLTCDSVVELDADLRMAEHTPSLSAMLLHNRPGATLAGMEFADLLAGAAEAARVVEILRRFEDCPPDSVNAQAFHTHLVDSDSNRFRTEVFQVMYHTPQGNARHLIGLRDVTDQESLSGSRAIESLSVVPRSVTPGSAGACSSIEASEHLQTRAIAHDKFLSLLIDMDLQLIHLSSQPICLGCRPSDLFCAAGVELLERLWAVQTAPNAATAQNRGSGLPNYSFSALELRLGHEPFDVSGTLQVVETQTGDRYLLLVCVMPLALTIAPKGSFGSPGSDEYTSVQF